MKSKRTPTQVPASLKNVDLQSIMRRAKVYEAREKYLDTLEAARPLARKLLESKKKPVVKASTPRHLQFSDEIINGYWEKQIHIVDVIEQRFENKVRQFIEKIGRNFVATLDIEVSNQKDFVKFLKKDYFSDNEDSLLNEATIDFAPLLDNVAILAGNEANKLIGVKDPYMLTTMRKKILDNIEFFTKSMLNTDREHLATLITNGIQEGKSIPEIRGMIEEDFSQYSKMQATRITRTEVLRASNEASVDAYKESGVVEGKQWLTAGADDECADYDGEVVGLDEDFSDGDPPLHPNCRCVLLPVLEGEKAYAPPINKANVERIKDLEQQLDKRTKAAKELLSQKTEDEIYIKSLEKHLGLSHDDV